MISLVLVTTFTPFLWGDAKVSTLEMTGFETMLSCREQASKFQSYKSQEGTTVYSKYCVDKGSK